MLFDYMKLRTVCAQKFVSACGDLDIVLALDSTITNDDDWAREKNFFADLVINLSTRLAPGKSMQVI